MFPGVAAALSPSVCCFQSAERADRQLVSVLVSHWSLGPNAFTLAAPIHSSSKAAPKVHIFCNAAVPSFSLQYFCTL